MLKGCTTLFVVTIISTTTSFAAPGFDASTGDASHTTSTTGSGPQGMGGGASRKTGKQQTCNLPTGLGWVAKPGANTPPGGLPPCKLDSLVKMSEEVFGDEGKNGTLPPFFGFDEQHRLARTIADPNPELSTFHGSELPAAWGKDEFIGGPEMSMSGPSN